jgi:hypothetical protein
MSKPWSFHCIKLFELLLFSFWKPWDGISDHVFLSFFDSLFSPFALQIAARAKYSVAYDGTFPDLYLPNFENETVTSTTGGPVEQISSAQLRKKAWKLYMPNAYHPLLLQRHQKNIHRAKRDVASATAVSLSGSK